MRGLVVDRDRSDSFLHRMEKKQTQQTRERRAEEFRLVVVAQAPVDLEMTTAINHLAADGAGQQDPKKSV